MLPSDPFKRLTAGGTYTRTFQIFAERYDLFFIISAIVFVPLALLMIATMQFYGSYLHTMTAMLDGQRTLQSSYYSSSFDQQDASSELYGNNYNTANAFGADNTDLDTIFADASNDMAAISSRFMSQFALEYVLFMWVAFAGEAAMAYAVAEMYAGRRPEWSACLRQGCSRWCAIFGSAVLVGFGVAIPNFIVQLLFAALMQTKNTFLIIVAIAVVIAWSLLVIYVMVAAMMLTPVIMVERNGPINSLKRCWELATNNRCYLFCAVFSLATLYSVVQILISLVLRVNIFEIWGAVILTLPALVYVPMAVIVKTVVYLNIRVQQEGLNRPFLVNELYGEECPASKDFKYAIVEPKQEAV